MFTVSKHLVQLWLDPLWNFLYLLNESVSDSEHGKERANKHLWGGSVCLEKAHNAKVSPGGQCSQYTSLGNLQGLRMVVEMRMYPSHIHKILRMCHMGSDVNTWSPIGGAAWVSLGGTGLLGGVCYWGWLWDFSASCLRCSSCHACHLLPQSPIMMDSHRLEPYPSMCCLGHGVLPQQQKVTKTDGIQHTAPETVCLKHGLFLRRKK